MLDRIIAAIALALLRHIESRIERGRVAVDSVRDVDGMRRMGSRIREWLRSKDGAGP